MSINPAALPGADRKLYAWAAGVAIFIAVGGFARTYYLKFAFDTPPLSGLIHLHAALMTAWVVLFVTQIRFIAARRKDLHRNLGLLGAALAAAIVAVGVPTSIEAARRGITTPGMPPLTFLVVPLATALVFAVLVTFGIAFRRRTDIHKRLMLLATLSILTPAIARVPWEAFRAGGPLLFLGLTDVCIFAFVAYDTVKNRRLHPAFGWGTLFILISQPARILLAHTAAWDRFAAWLTA
ncbi:MAG: hypothetical protein ABJB01_12885 [Rudaea sp.]